MTYPVKKGGFVTHRHNNIQAFFTVLLDKFCTIDKNEPHLLSVTTERFPYQTSNTQDGARLDMKASDFWRCGQIALMT